MKIVMERIDTFKLPNVTLAVDIDGNMITYVMQAKAENEARRHKYKRCLAMAKWCENEEKRLEAIAPIFDTDKECWEYNSDYWFKWRRRWLELAEKFKEANDGND